jgi:hypothetical protein
MRIGAWSKQGAWKGKPLIPLRPIKLRSDSDQTFWATRALSSPLPIDENL